MGWTLVWVPNPAVIAQPRVGYTPDPGFAPHHDPAPRPSGRRTETTLAATDHRNPIGLHARRSAALALAAGAVIALSACEKRDEATEKLSNAKSQLLSVSGGRGRRDRRHCDQMLQRSHRPLGTVNGGATGAAAKLFAQCSWVNPTSLEVPSKRPRAR